MPAVTLSPGFQVVALHLQEAAMMHSDVAKRLSDAVNDAHRGAGNYGSYIDHNGDGETGDCIYSCNGDMRSAPYEISSQGGKAVANIDMDNSTNVVPVTTWQEEADDDDHYASMSEAFIKKSLYTALPLYERFISKGERDNADEGDFAGKGKSFPILKPGDVQAAVHAMGRAGSSNYGMAQLKANIIRIAKKKGWTSYLPKAWQDGGDSKESRVSHGTNGSLNLLESASTLETIVLKEAKADYEIKLIAPGKGSSAFYPAEVLKRDGPKVFTQGTHVYLNHPTAAEEAARPEGDVKNLAGVLSTDAVYHESHAKGPGLYARMKVFADHAQTVEEKAPHVGMSIRASGVAESGKKQDGLPILKELTSAESVDVVTRAGAGGMILQEGLRPRTEGQEMTLQEAQALIREGVQAATAPLLERALRADAREEAMRVLEDSRLPDVTKRKIVESALRSTLPIKDGNLDVEKFRTVVVAEAKAEAEYVATLTGAGRVTGLGPSFGVAAPDPEKLREAEKRAKKEAKRVREAEQQIFGRLMGNSKAAEFAVNRGEAA